MTNDLIKYHTALEAYDAMADRFESHASSSAHNAYCERPAMLSMLPDVKGCGVLDAGCGAGFYAEWLIQNGAGVTAVDGSAKMVAITRRRLGASVDVRQWDLNHALHFLKAKTFELILCPLVLDHIEDLNRVFSEFYRLLKSSGVLLFSIGHPAHDFAKHGGTYYCTELIDAPVPRFGITFPYYRRSFEAIINPLLNLGFNLEEVVAPKPIEACKDKYPDAYERLSRRPSFLCVRVRKCAR